MLRVVTTLLTLVLATLRPGAVARRHGPAATLD
jgi:hypothetical protein